MIANTIKGRIKTFNSIPKVFELKPNVMGYNKLDSSVHYADGFREIVLPTLEANQYKKDLYFDAENDIYTYNIENYTEEEIKQQEIYKEFNLYQQRQSDGMNLYLMHVAEWRTLYIKEVITKEEFNAIEDNFKTVRIELVNGQLKTALEIFNSLPEETKKTTLYSNFLIDLQNKIKEFY